MVLNFLQTPTIHSTEAVVKLCLKYCTPGSTLIVQVVFVINFDGRIRCPPGESNQIGGTVISVACFDIYNNPLISEGGHS